MPSKSVMTLDDILTPSRNNFGAIRVALALAVVISHSFYLVSGLALVTEPVHAWTGYTLGQHAVQLFFVLSGILVAQSLVRGGLPAYAKARALRILPGLVVCVLITALVLGPLVSSTPGAQYFADGALYRYILDTVSLKTGMAPLPGVFDENPAAGVVNSSLWTLKYEVICYVLLGVIGALALRSGVARAAGWTALAVFVVVALYDRPALVEGNTALDQVQYFALFFGTGVLAYALRRHIPLHAGGVALAFALLALTNKTAFAEFGHALGLGYAMLWLGSLEAGRVRAFTNDNDFSYGVYIYGVPVGQTLLVVWPTIPVAALIFATATISLVLAAVSWRLVERPALALRHRSAGRLANRAATTAEGPVTRLIDAGTQPIARRAPRIKA
ncbi:MAG: acyltransferase family protein [Hyphomicrobiaceae bacterium]